MGDLHLPFGRQKPMDIFGGWENYTERIEKNWNSVVGEDDCVVIPGDISWAMSIEEALPDFEFISRRLRGRKIISKGNHDYWWTTLKKMNGFLQTNGFDNIRILHNNAFEECGIAICGTRGWFYELEEPGSHTEKMRNREAGRLETSLRAAGEREKICFLHYPPLYTGYKCEEMLRLLQQYDVKKCYYGHLHGGTAHARAVQGERDGTEFSLVSADYLRFRPKKILE